VNQKPQINSLADMRRQSALLKDTVYQAMLQERPIVGKQSWLILRNALGISGNEKLYQRTILDKEIRIQHKERMVLRFQKLVASIKKNAKGTAAELEAQLRDRLRFITIVHGVEGLDVGRTIYQVREMQALISKCIKEFPRVKCIGAAEVEVVNVEMMGRARAFMNAGSGEANLKQPESIRRKLEVIEALMPSSCVGSSTIALIHFHGVIDLGQKHDQIKDFIPLRLKSEEQWSRAGHQVQIKALTEVRGGKRKSVDKNLEHIARYITKGGNMLYQDNNYFRYKLSFDQDDLDPELEMIAQGHRSFRESNSKIRQESKEEGIENDLAMTYEEVAYLAQVVNKMMEINRTRDGYVLSI
jgi:hypothetical protein